LTEYVTVSAKIPKELRRKLAELGIQPSKVIRRALEAEVEKRTMNLLREKVEKAAGIISRIGVENWVRAVRESRDER